MTFFFCHWLNLPFLGIAFDRKVGGFSTHQSVQNVCGRPPCSQDWGQAGSREETVSILRAWNGRELKAEGENSDLPLSLCCSVTKNKKKKNLTH